MSLETYQKEVEHLGESRGAKDHDHDLVHDLSRRLDALWRYDQYVANAEGYESIKGFVQKWPKMGNTRTTKQAISRNDQSRSYCVS